MDASAEIANRVIPMELGVNDVVTHSDYDGAFLIVEVRANRFLLKARPPADEEYPEPFEAEITGWSRRSRRAGTIKTEAALATATDNSTKPRTLKEQKSGDRWKIHNNFVDFTLPELMRQARYADIAVWWVLYRDTKEGIAVVALETLAKAIARNKATVIHALKRLEADGLVQVKRGRKHRTPDGVVRQLPNRYRVRGLLTGVA